MTVTHEPKSRKRAPSDPVAQAMAILARMTPDSLHLLGQKLAADLPRSAAVLSESMAGRSGT